MPLKIEINKFGKSINGHSLINFYYLSLQGAKQQEKDIF